MIDFLKINNPIQICDIGASPIDETDFIEELLDNTDSRLIGFEPNENEFQKLDKNKKRRKYYNFGIGDGTEKTLNICKAAGMSSFLEPDINYLKNFHGFEKWSKIIKKVKVKTKKLSEIEDNIDFFKIDVQGYESEIIKHGKDKIKNSLIINIETSPTPLYKNEKTFSSTIIELEKLGFNLHMFSKINTRSFKPIIFFKNPYIGLNHIHQLDCVLIKNLKFIETYNTSQLSKLILILFYSFKSYDLVDYLLKILDERNGSKFVEKYRTILSKIKIVKKY